MATGSRVANSLTRATRDLEEGAGLLAFKRELRELETRAEVLARS